MPDIRYVTRRPNKDGSERIYWQRPGHPLTRLDGDNWPAVAAKLNAMADEGQTALREGTIRWLINEYRESEEFAKLARSTQTVYGRWLKEFDAMWGDLSPAYITRKVAVDFKKRIASPYVRVHATATLYNLLELAKYHGLVETNQASKLRVGQPPARKQLWSDEEIERYREGCRGVRHGDGLRMGHYLLLYTGQRPSDVVKMRRADYDGEYISVVQQKTGAKLKIAAHRSLKAVLNPYLAESNSLFLVSRDNGRPFSRVLFSMLSQQIRQDNDLMHVQLRDLRRTTVCKLFEAGCEIGEIAAITGHSLSNVNSILETYFVRTAGMSRSGVTKLENKESAQSLTR